MSESRVPESSAADNRHLADRLADDLVRINNQVTHMLQTRAMAYANRTFADFLKACREIGLRDDDVLASIEFGCASTGTGYIRKERNEDGAIEIHEVTREELGR